MGRCILLGAAAALMTVSAWSAARQPNDPAQPAADQQPRQPAAAGGRRQGEDLVDHGRYLVHEVAMCIYCHTPRRDGGEIDRQKLLSGARMPVESPFPEQQWCFFAPNLAGLPGGWSRQEMVTFLQTGVRPGGTVPRPPMPPFRMTERDARAVAAYLESLR